MKRQFRKLSEHISLPSKAKIPKQKSKSNPSLGIILLLCSSLRTNTASIELGEMGTVTAALLLPSKLNPSEAKHTFFLERDRRRSTKNKNHSIVPVARLFGPAIFEASKLKVLFLGAEKKHPGKFPRTYTLTHSDITSKLTLAISQTINNSQLQGWYNRLQRDEVVAEWKKIKGKMSLHVHCHISGGHFLLDLCARLRYYIFCKELPVVLKAFVHGDEDLFNNYPELEEALAWVYFHSSIPEFNKVECWGPLKEASAPPTGAHMGKDCFIESNKMGFDTLQPCPENCACCFPPMSLIPWPKQHHLLDYGAPSKAIDQSSFLSGDYDASS